MVVTFESADEIPWCDRSNAALQQDFHMVLFIQYVVLTFESVHEILRCDPSHETSIAVLIHMVLFI